MIKTGLIVRPHKSADAGIIAFIPASFPVYKVSKMFRFGENTAAL